MDAQVVLDWLNWLGSPEGQDWIWLIVGIAIAVAILLYVRVFIRDFTFVLGHDSPKPEETEGVSTKEGIVFSDGDLKAMHRIIVHAYIVTVLAFFLSILPFVLFPINPSLMTYLERTPIGVLIGCQDTVEPLVTACRTIDPENFTPLPDPTKAAMQWVVNFGGSVSNTACDSYGAACTTSDQTNIHVLEGGLVVPLYLIIVALMGAAVGLARRLPEYQKRGSPSYRDIHGNDPSIGDPPMIPAQVRECVVFQIMQFMTAPLVAVTSYALIQPNAWETVVLLGFASGFSTEAVLMMIRRGVDKIAKPSKSSSTPVQDPKPDPNSDPSKTTTPTGKSPSGSGQGAAPGAAPATAAGAAAGASATPAEGRVAEPDPLLSPERVFTTPATAEESDESKPAGDAPRGMPA